MSREKKNLYKKSLGAWGEENACSFLENNGYSIEARNIRTPYGEIDIIASLDNKMIFVEVKTRSSISDGYPEDAITSTKIKHMEDSINWYLDSHPAISDNWRVDVISIVGRQGSAQPPKFEWWQNEF